MPRHTNVLMSKKRMTCEMKSACILLPSSTKVSSFLIVLGAFVLAHWRPKSLYLKTAVVMTKARWIQRVKQQLSRATTYLSAMK